MVALIGPNSTTCGQMRAMKRPSEVPPLVDSSGGVPQVSLMAALMADTGASPENILPQWRQFDPTPGEKMPAEPVPGAPRQFRWIGAWQEPGDSFAVKVGPQPLP